MSSSKKKAPKSSPASKAQIEWFHAAVKAGDLKKVTALLKGDPGLIFGKGSEFDETPLHRAADRGHREIAELLLANGADVNATDKISTTPLHWAADEERMDVAKLLLAHKAKVDARDKDGHTPLHHAAAKGSLEVAKLLLANKAKVNAKGESSKTPLHWAGSYEHVEIVKLLLASKADVNARKDDGLTALHDAASGEHMEVAMLLVANGADLNARCKRGHTPADLAEKFGRDGVAELLRKEGAPPAKKESKKSEMSAKGRARIAAALKSRIEEDNAGTESGLSIDLRKDAADIRKMLAKAVGAYALKHKARGSAKKHPLVTRIDLIFSLGDSVSIPWVHLNIDTKPGSEPDGDPTHPDLVKLNRKAWLPIVQANSDGEFVSVVTQDGDTRKCAGDELYEVIGNFLVAMLLEARQKRVFAKLPKADHCELGVEDPSTGAFGWPAYEDRGVSLVE